MKREPAWRRYLRFWGSDPARDVDDEFRFHLHTKTEELIGRGMTAEAARREALRQFGPAQPYRDECRSVDTGRLAAAARREYAMGWIGDVRYAARVLGRAKGSTLMAVAILATSIGAGTAVFTFLDRLLYAPLPVREPSRLVTIAPSPIELHGKVVSSQSFPYEAYLNLRDRNSTFAGIAGEANFGLREKQGGVRIEKPAWARAVSGNYFEVLGVQPLLGRALAASDEAASGDPHVAVAGYRFWSRRFGGSPHAVGSTIYLNDEPFVIVGVMPQGFYGTNKGDDVDLYVPIAGRRPAFLLTLEARLIGRLRPGVSARTAQVNLQVLWAAFVADDHAPWKPYTYGASVVCGDGSAGYAGAQGETRRSLTLLAAIVGLLLLMSCINVACLLAARGAARRHEMAIRLSLGAGKTRILRQSMLESLLIALAGGLAGILLSVWASRLLLIAFQWKDKPIDLAPDVRVLAFGFGLSLFTGLLFGIGPALQSIRGARLGPGNERTVAPSFASGKTLIVVEVALSLVMVAGSAIFVRSFRNLRTEPTGFSAEHISVIGLAPADPGDRTRLTAAAIQLAEFLRAAPRIEAVGMADLLTFDDSRIGYPVIVPEAPPQAKRDTNVLRVDSGYFSTLRIRLLAGRTFTASDDAHAPMVVILGESAARRLFGNQSPIGRHIEVGRAQPEVVGIVKDIKFTRVTEPAPEAMFQPLTQGWFGGARSGGIKLQVRSRMAAEDVAAMARTRIRELRLPVTVERARALEDAIGASMISDRVRMQASTLFGALALALIAAGIYGLMAYSVTQRTREIGVRMAVGSEAAGILRLVLSDSLRLTLVGIAIGLPGALALMKAISGMLYGMGPFDAASLAAAAALLAATSVAASAAPAWRAAHLDPVRALRVE